MDFKTGLISLTAASVLAFSTAYAADDIETPAEPQDQAGASIGPDLNPPAEADTRELPPQDLGDDAQDEATAAYSDDEQADDIADIDTDEEAIGGGEAAGAGETAAVEADDDLPKVGEEEPQQVATTNTQPESYNPTEADATALYDSWAGSDGELTVDEWDAAVDRVFEEQDVNLAVARWDDDGDGVISRVEFEEAIANDDRFDSVLVRGVGGGTAAGAGEANLDVEDDQAALNEEDSETIVEDEDVYVEDEADAEAVGGGDAAGAGEAGNDDIETPAEPQDQAGASIGPDLNPPAEPDTRELPPQDLGDDAQDEATAAYDE